MGVIKVLFLGLIFSTPGFLGVEKIGKYFCGGLI